MKSQNSKFLPPGRHTPCHWVFTVEFRYKDRVLRGLHTLFIGFKYLNIGDFLYKLLLFLSYFHRFLVHHLLFFTNISGLGNIFVLLGSVLFVLVQSYLPATYLRDKMWCSSLINFSNCSVKNRRWTFFYKTLGFCWSFFEPFTNVFWLFGYNY